MDYSSDRVSEKYCYWSYVVVGARLCKFKAMFAKALGYHSVSFYDKKQKVRNLMAHSLEMTASCAIIHASSSSCIDYTVVLPDRGLGYLREKALQNGKFYVAISGRQLLNQPTKTAIPITLTLTARKCTSLQCSRLGQLLPPSCSRLLHLKQFFWTRLTTMGGYRYWISYFRYAISDIVLFSLIRSFRYPTEL